MHRAMNGRVAPRTETAVDDGLFSPPPPPPPPPESERHALSLTSVSAGVASAAPQFRAFAGGGAA